MWAVVVLLSCYISSRIREVLLSAARPAEIVV